MEHCDYWQPPPPLLPLLSSLSINLDRIHGIYKQLYMQNQGMQTEDPVITGTAGFLGVLSNNCKLHYYQTK